MKEFEKWYDEYSYWAEIDEEGLPLKICKDAWIASKEATLNQILKERDVWGDGFDDCVFDMIEEELKNLNQGNSQSNDC